MAKRASTCRWTENRLSRCEYGCKWYWCETHQIYKLIHNRTYGCNKGRKV